MTRRAKGWLLALAVSALLWCLILWGLSAVLPSGPMGGT